MPTYVLSKLKRSIASDKIGDLIDIDLPTAALTALDDGADSLIVYDSDASSFKIITRANLLTWLNANVAATWGKVSGIPSTFPPSSHQHAAGDVTSGVFDAARIPSVPQLLALADPDDRNLTVGTSFTVTLAAATGGTTPYTYSIVGTLPAGLSFNANTRVLSGTPTAAGLADVMYKVVDDGTGGSAQTAEREFMITILPAGSRYILVRTTRTSITAVQLSAGNQHAVNARSLTLPTWSGSRYIVIGQPAGQPDLTRISLAGLGNSISDFDKQSYEVTSSGVSYELWVGKELQGDAISGEIIEVLP